MINSNSSIQKNNISNRDWTSPGLWLALIIAVPFALGAAALGWNLLRMPATAGQLAKVSLLQAHLFAFGFALGLVGAAVAVTTSSPQRRLLGTAATLFGCSHILLGFIGQQVIKQYLVESEVSLLPFMIPVILWSYSVWLALKSHGLDKNQNPEKKDPTDTLSNEEQPQLQSRS